MAVLGPRAAIDWALPTGIDADEILKFQLRSGLSGAQVIGMAAGQIGAVNVDLVRQYGGILSMTEGQFAFARQGETSRSQTPLKAEFAIADAVRSDEIGGMLPIADYEDAVAWTPIYLRDARQSQIDADLQLIADRWRNRVEYDLLTRIFTNTENSIGDSGYDVPWAIGTGTNVDYIPPQYSSYVFSSSHSHFNYHNDTTEGVDWATALEAAALDLRHHGLSGPLQAFFGDSDLDEVIALTNFVELNPTNIQIIAGNSSAPIYAATGELNGVPGELFGFYKSKKWGLIELYRWPRIPENYGFMTRSFGNNNPRNGLAVREHPVAGFGMRVDPQVTNSLMPELDFVLFKATHGVGVNNRLNGVAMYLAAGAAAWANPSIT